ncbi:hypothetical protein ABRP56_09115 [Pectobacterium odoriferum]|uniref:hypothetical protein n=1 Tax=Pectobacterium odoriferum TaxID=78398 RepID=UPI0032ED4DB0
MTINIDSILITPDFRKTEKERLSLIRDSACVVSNSIESGIEVIGRLALISADSVLLDEEEARVILSLIGEFLSTAPSMANKVNFIRNEAIDEKIKRESAHEK